MERLPTSAPEDKGDHHAALRQTLTRSKRKQMMVDMATSLSALYAMILVSVYLAFVFTEIVTFPKYEQYLEKSAFFIYLYVVSVLFLLYVFGFTLWGRQLSKASGGSYVVENHKSHGSLPVRFGAVVFGLGTLTYFVLETIAFLEIHPDSPCHYPTFGANVILSMMLVVLQTYLIFMYPRLNLRISSIIDRFGSMHLVATNVILWIRTLVKESLHEIAESKEAAHHGERDVDEKCNLIGDMIVKFERNQEACMEFENEILGDAVLKSSPYLYPFVIEYSLIGASMFFLMWLHVDKLPKCGHDGHIRKPNPKGFLSKGDWSKSSKGVIVGLFTLGLAFINLGLFFGLKGHEKTGSEAEFYSKIVNTVTNVLGILVLLLGLRQIEFLDPKPESEDDVDEASRASGELDLTLLRFTMFFSYLYHNFTIITGSFNDHVEDFPNALHVVNGLVEAIQITMQMMFVIEIKRKVLPETQLNQKPARQVTAFLFLLNFSQWIVLTFEIQKVRASVVEAEFYGFLPWVVIQRVTLPLAVFFRFHSSVVSIELWKEIYCKSL